MGDIWAITPKFTPKGFAFWISGGYTGGMVKKQKEKATQLIKSVAVEVLKETLRNL